MTELNKIKRQFESSVMVRSPQVKANNSVDFAEALNENDLVNGVHNQTQINELISIDTNVSVNSNAQKSPSPNGLGEKRKQHNCPYCDRSFTRPYRLNDHISFSHTDEVFFAIFYLILQY